MVDAVKLTDDEVVALAGRVGGAWMGPLPSVDDGNSVSLMQAFLRGERSFAMRGGVVMSSEGVTYSLADLGDMFGDAFGVRPQLLGYVADRTTPTVPAGTSIAVFRRDEASRIVALTRREGITEFALVDSTSARQIIRTMWEAPSAATENTGMLAVVLAAPTGESSGRTLTVTKDTAHEGTFDADGVNFVVRGLADGSLEELLAGV